jgi:outer membrane protein assembly factor BamA
MEQVVPTTGHLSADTAVVQPDTTRKASVQEDRKDTVSVYGENVRIDFRNFAFSEVPGVKPDSAESEEPVPVSENIDEEGNYKPIRYKLNFSPDIVYGNAAFSTFYGVQGTTMMAFSDMLGDHQIFFLTNLLLDLKNSDYVLAYYYLPLKVDLGIQGFHSARFLFLEDPYTGYAYLYRFRSWGLSGSALYPLDKYNRIDLGTTWLNLSRESMEYSYIPAQRRTLIVPSVSFVHDNSLWGFLSPNNGKRYNISVMVSPDLGSDGLDFKTLTGDHRSYFKFWGDYVFAMRFAGGISVGRNPMRFFIGGIDGWINREFEANGFPIENVEDYAFLSPVLPLRGYNYNIRNGNKYILMNYEMRYPLIRYLVTGAVPIALQNITGATFIDIGSAWSRNREYQGIGRDVEGNIVTKDLLIGTGFGARMILLGLPFKFDVAWSFNIDGFSVPKYYISLGTDY